MSKDNPAVPSAENFCLETAQALVLEYEHTKEQRAKEQKQKFIDEHREGINYLNAVIHKAASSGVDELQLSRTAANKIPGLVYENCHMFAQYYQDRGFRFVPRYRRIGTTEVGRPVEAGIESITISWKRRPKQPNPKPSAPRRLTEGVPSDPR